MYVPELSVFGHVPADHLRVAFLSTSSLKGQNSTCKYFLNEAACACLFPIAHRLGRFDCRSLGPPYPLQTEAVI